MSADIKRTNIKNPDSNGATDPNCTMRTSVKYKCIICIVKGLQYGGGIHYHYKEAVNHLDKRGMQFARGRAAKMHLVIR